MERFYKYFIETIDEYMDGNKKPLETLLKNLSRLRKEWLSIFSSQDLKFLREGFQTNHTTKLLYLKYKFMLYLDENEINND